MWSYPTKQSPDPDADPNNHGLTEEEPVGAVIPSAEIENAKLRAEKLAEREKK